MIALLASAALASSPMILPVSDPQAQHISNVCAAAAAVRHAGEAHPAHVLLRSQVVASN